jgi:hypothetical protein
MNGTVLFLSCLLSLQAPVPAGPVKAPGPVQVAPPARVKLDISAQEDIKSLIQRAVGAELQSRGVQVVEGDADWTIGVVTTRLGGADGTTVAVGLSYIIEQHGIHMRMMLALAQACRYFLSTGLLRDAPLEKDMQMLLRGVEVIPKPESLSVVSQHRMCVVTPDRLPQVCHDVVTAFDAERLGPQPKAEATAQAGPAPAPVPPAAPQPQGK